MPILLVRHGNTTYDTRVDAILDPPLTKEGVDRLKRTAEFLKSYQISRIISSPLQRTLKPAQMFSRGNIKLTTSNGALPWNLGDLMGKQSTLVKDELEYLKIYPDIKAPHGESYREFLGRWDEFLRRVMTLSELSEDYIVIVTHSRNINALQVLIDGVSTAEVQEIAPEGSVTLLADNGVNSWSFEQVWDGN